LGEIRGLEGTDRCDYGTYDTVEEFNGNGMPLNGNPLIFPNEDVLAGGTSAILAYLRNEAWWHIQRLVIGGLLPVGIIATFMLSMRLRDAKAKRKRGNT
jgi:hypothetical protein